MIQDLAALLARPGQPGPLFAALDAAFQQRVGHQLFTLLLVDGKEVARLYSSRPQEYPVGGRKPMGTTPWGAHVIHGKQPWLTRDKAGIRWAFFDHALIEGMGLGSNISIPVVYDDTCLGTISLLHAEGHYREPDVARAAELAPLLIPAFLQARRT